MIGRDKAVAITGYDISKILETSLELNLLNELLNLISTSIDKLHADGYTTFISPVNDGFEMLAANSVIKSKEKYPDINLIVVLPSIVADSKLSSPDKYRYKRILEKADKTVIIADKELYPSVKLIDYIVDNSSCVLCYCDGKHYVTEQIYSLAQRENRTTINLCNKFT